MTKWGFQEKHYGSEISGCWNDMKFQRKFQTKFHRIPSYKNKINMSVFPLKPSFSHFSISFLLWIPSSSLPDQVFSCIYNLFSKEVMYFSIFPLEVSQISTKLHIFTYGLYICSKSGRIVSRIWKSLRPRKKASILVWFWRTTILLQKHQNC